LSSKRAEVFNNSPTRCDLSIPEAVITVVRAPDDGCQHPKHVELPIEI